jgi:hypothetical protein
MKSVSARRSRSPSDALLRSTNQRQTGIPVVKKSWPGRATTQSTRSVSTSFRRIAPSPRVFEVSEPFAITNPARPSGVRWWVKCWIQA